MRSTPRCNRIPCSCSRSRKCWERWAHRRPARAGRFQTIQFSPRGYNRMDARSSYREAAVRGATPVQLVILLYEQGIEDLRRAIIALEKNDIEARTREINHALMVIGQLQASLDMERGGEVAR